MTPEKFPVHLMIKPEGREIFPDYLRTQIELLEINTGARRFVHTVTVLSPEQVNLIYPQESIPIAFKKFLSENHSEHFILHGNEAIYDQAKRMKGKYMSGGIRGTLSGVVPRLGIPFERWQNFIHSTDTLQETVPICAHLNNDLATCRECVARSTCYGVKGSDMPSDIVKW